TDLTLSSFCEGIISRNRDARFPERLAERIHQTRTYGVRCLSYTLEEELREVCAASTTRPELVVAYFGWDGGGTRTLEMVGSTQGITRERVRQLVGGVTDRLAEATVWTPILRQALEACKDACPRPVEEIANLLHRNELTAAPFHPHGLLTAAETLGMRQP